MSERSKIKVIKKGENVSADSASAVTADNEKRSKQAAAREMVSNVSNWVTEFKQRRKTETKKAFESLFSQQTPTTNI